MPFNNWDGLCIVFRTMYLWCLHFDSEYMIKFVEIKQSMKFTFFNLDHFHAHPNYHFIYSELLDNKTFRPGPFSRRKVVRSHLVRTIYSRYTNETSISTASVPNDPLYECYENFFWPRLQYAFLVFFSLFISDGMHCNAKNPEIRLIHMRPSCFRMYIYSTHFVR